MHVRRCACRFCTTFFAVHIVHTVGSGGTRPSVSNSCRVEWCVYKVCVYYVFTSEASSERRILHHTVY